MLALSVQAALLVEGEVDSAFRWLSLLLVEVVNLFWVRPSWALDLTKSAAHLALHSSVPGQLSTLLHPSALPQALI